MIFKMDLDKIYQELAEIISVKNIKLNESMKKHTSFKIGGNADFFIKVDNKENLKKIVKFSKNNNIPLTIIGNGTNILVKDEGIRGIVLQPNFDLIHTTQINNDKILLEVGSSITLPKLSQLALQDNLTGLEFAVGIPGTIGGAIKMNAGAYGGQIEDLVVSTTYLDLDTCEEHTINKEEHNFEYRKSIFSKINTVIIETTLELQYGNNEQIKQKMDEYTALRKAKQPTEPSAGSTFKRGTDYITAQLIDECGLKGYSVGDAMVSTKHAGFIINKGNAKAEDVIELVEQIKTKVKAKFDKEIKLEIDIMQ